MKALIAVLLLAFSSAAFADGTTCANFSGHFVNKSTGHEEYTITQTDCSEVTVEYKSSDLGAAESITWTITYIMDGVRHPYGDYFYMAKWDNSMLVTEPWSAETGGEMIGLRSIWSLQHWSEGDSILMHMIDPDSGFVDDRVLWKTN